MYPNKSYFHFLKKLQKWKRICKSEAREMRTTLMICPGSPSSLLFTCFVFKFKSFTITVLLCLKILVISPTLPLSLPVMICTVSPSLTCILCRIGRLFGLHFFRSHRLSCQNKIQHKRIIINASYTISY